MGTSAYQRIDVAYAITRVQYNITLSRKNGRRRVAGESLALHNGRLNIVILYVRCAGRYFASRPGKNRNYQLTSLRAMLFM